MVSAGKVFKLREQLGLQIIASKLKNFKREESFGEEPSQMMLLTGIHDLALKRNRLKGVYTEDRVFYIFYRGEQTPIPMTIEVLFAFVKLAMSPG